MVARPDAGRRTTRQLLDGAQRLPGAGGGVRRAGGRDRRGPRRPRRPAPRAARAGRAGRVPVRLLHPGLRVQHGGGVLPARPGCGRARPRRRCRPGPQRLRPARARRQPVPLHRLPPDPRRGVGAGRPRPRRPARDPARRPRPRRRGHPDATRATATSPGPPTSARRWRCCAERPDAVVVAGSTDWGVEVNLRGRRAPYVVAVDRLPELRGFEVSDRSVTLGAALTLSRAREAARRAAAAAGPGVAAVRVPADPQRRDHRRQPRHRLADRRHRPRAARARGRRRPGVRARRAGGAAGGLLHRLPADGARARRADPRRTRARCRRARLVGFHKIAKRRCDDISSVAIGFALDVADGVVDRARIGLGGVAATPVRALATEQALEGRPWTEETVAAAAEVMRGEGTPDRRPCGPARPTGRRCSAPRCPGCSPPRPPVAGPMSRLSERPEGAVVGEQLAHESAALHVTGHALYTDDLVQRTPDVLHAHPVGSPHAHARVTALRVGPAYDVPGVVRVLTADDVPGVNDAGVKHDEPLFPDEVMFVGHAVCWVLGETARGRPAGRGRRRGRLRAAAVAGRAARGDRGAVLPGRPADRRARATSSPGSRRRGARLQRRDRDGGAGALLPRDALLARPRRRGRPGLRAVQHPAPHRDPGDRRPRARRPEPRGDRAVPADGRRLRGQGDAAPRLRRGRRARRDADRPPGAAAAHPPAGHDDDRQAARLPRRVAGRLRRRTVGCRRSTPRSPPTAAGASTCPSRCWRGRCATSTTPTGSRTCGCTAGSRRPTRPRRRRSAGSAGRRGCS